MSKIRCAWATNQFDLYEKYHDEEWGVPTRDENRLFEFLLLEGAQAGLSWSTILKKREGYREAFADFDPYKVSNYSADDMDRCLQNPRIVRNRLKVQSAVINARCFLEIQQEFGGFSDFIWRYVDNKPIQNTWTDLQQVPAHTPLSDRISKDLKKRGFKFVGSTIMYAFMQATGLVNDHTTDCFRYAEVQAL